MTALTGLRSVGLVILALLNSTGASADVPTPLTRYVVEADMDRVERESGSGDPEKLLEDSAKLLDARLAAMDAPEHAVTYLSDGRMIIEIRGSGSRDLVERAVGIAAQMEFRIVAGEVSAKEASKGIDLVSSTEGSDPVPLLRTPAINGRYVVSANSSFDPYIEEPVVVLEFDEPGTAMLAQITSAYSGQEMAIVLDGSIISKSSILGPILEGRLQIASGFSQDTAEKLAIQLRAGSGVSVFEIVEEQLVE